MQTVNSTQRSEEGRYRRQQKSPPTHTYESGSPERMLDRYGISYICQHPEILFDRPYVPTLRLYRRGDRSPSVYALDGSQAPSAGEDRDEIAVRLARIMEAYGILHQIYAPVDPAGGQGPAGSRHVQPRQQHDGT